MSITNHNLNNRERKTIILLSVIVFFTAGILFLHNNQEEPAPSTENDSIRTAYRKDYNRGSYTHYKYKERNKYKQGYKHKERYKHKEYRNYEPRKKDYRSYRKDTLYKSNKFRTLTLVDANTADSATLCRIPGIGPTISSIIIRYRTRLGGFYSKKQLMECKFFTEDLLEWFAVDSLSALRKININDDSLRVLYMHPYISYKQAKDIKNHRRLNGRFKNEDALRHTFIFTPEEVDKVAPYFDY